VDRTPDAVAAIAGVRNMTYRDLDRLANRLAHRLLRLHGAREHVVGVLADRSLEYLVAVLGTMKAGGVCLPLDPRNPPSRLRYLLGHSGARTLLSHRRLGAALEADLGDRMDVMDVDGLDAKLQG